MARGSERIDGPAPAASLPPASRPDARAPDLERARFVAHVLDDLVRIPGTRRRVGLDPVLGLVPWLGDWLPLLASLDLIASAARRGAGAAVLLRMLGHVGVDALVGTVPLLGDLFDLGWKANRRNLAILERVAVDPERTRRRSRWIVGGVLAGGVLLVLAGIGTGVWVLSRVVRALFG